MTQAHPIVSSAQYVVARLRLLAAVCELTQHRAALAQPLTSSFGLLLMLKITLSLSVFGHFATAMFWRRRGVLGGPRSRRLHLSVFCHVLAIVLLAKAMFYVQW